MAKRRKFEIPAGAVYALLAATTLICITVLAVALAGEDGSKERLPPQTIPMSHLTIEDVYFMESEGYDQMRITIYMTNDGTDDADNVEAHIWPIIEGKNIATDKQQIEFGDILINETRVAEDYITLEEGTLHSVEILIFESGKMILKGKATISTDAREGTQYSDVEVKGTYIDSDYDGMADSWEEHYGLDPNDPTDAYRDNDGDGYSNLEEYRASEAPVDPGDDDDDGPVIDMLSGEESDEGAMAIGAGLFLVLVVGVIVALIIGAAVSQRKKEEGERPEPGPYPEQKQPAFEMEVREGYHDKEDDDDLPTGRGIYE